MEYIGQFLREPLNTPVIWGWEISVERISFSGTKETKNASASVLDLDPLFCNDSPT